MTEESRTAMRQIDMYLEAYRKGKKKEVLKFIAEEAEGMLVPDHARYLLTKIPREDESDDENTSILREQAFQALDNIKAREKEVGRELEERLGQERQKVKEKERVFLERQERAKKEARQAAREIGSEPANTLRMDAGEIREASRGQVSEPQREMVRTSSDDWVEAMKRKKAEEEEQIRKGGRTREPIKPEGRKPWYKFW